MIFLRLIQVMRHAFRKTLLAQSSALHQSQTDVVRRRSVSESASDIVEVWRGTVEMRGYDCASSELSMS